MLVDRENPFRAGFPRSARGSVVLTAKALNGVHNSIRLNPDPAGEPDSGSACRNIVGVNLQILPSDPTKPGVVWIQAKYLQRPATAECLFAPTFSANRRGLLIHPRDPFRAGIEKLPEVMTKVFAVAPNGVEGRIVF